MTTSMDADSIREAYEDVRNDTSETQWYVFRTAVCDTMHINHVLGLCLNSTVLELFAQRKVLILRNFAMSSPKMSGRSVISDFKLAMRCRNGKNFCCLHGWDQP